MTAADRSSTALRQVLLCLRCGHSEQTQRPTFCRSCLQVLRLDVFGDPQLGQEVLWCRLFGDLARHAGRVCAHEVGHAVHHPVHAGVHAPQPCQHKGDAAEQSSKPPHTHTAIRRCDRAGIACGLVVTGCAGEKRVNIRSAWASGPASAPCVSPTALNGRRLCGNSTHHSRRPSTTRMHTNARMLAHTVL